MDQFVFFRSSHGSVIWEMCLDFAVENPRGLEPYSNPNLGERIGREPPPLWHPGEKKTFWDPKQATKKRREKGGESEVVEWRVPTWVTCFAGENVTRNHRLLVTSNQGRKRSDWITWWVDVKFLTGCQKPTQAVFISFLCILLLWWEGQCNLHVGFLLLKGGDSKFKFEV